MLHLLESKHAEVTVSATTWTLLMGAIAIIILAVFVLVGRLNKRLSDELSETIQATTGRYGFILSVYVVLGVLYYHLALGITLDPTLILSFILASMLFAYFALRVAIASYYA
jgi:uncharacterized membrane protein